MEGSKGGSNGQEKWFTPYKSVKKRWLDYEQHRRLKGLPIIGSLHLFTKLWKQHKEVREFKACGHAKCDMCGQIQVEKARALSNTYLFETGGQFTMNTQFFRHIEVCTRMVSEVAFSYQSGIVKIGRAHV